MVIFILHIIQYTFIQDINDAAIWQHDALRRSGFAAMTYEIVLEAFLQQHNSEAGCSYSHYAWAQKPAYPTTDDYRPPSYNTRQLSSVLTR